MIDYLRLAVALIDVRVERDRQEALKATGRFTYTLGDPEMPDVDRIAAIGEEFGEVCTALLAITGGGSTTDPTQDLRKELIQLAACAVGWVEVLDLVAAPVEPKWCAASDRPCSIGPFGPHGERQCQYCGAPE